MHDKQKNFWRCDLTSVNQFARELGQKQQNVAQDPY